MSKVTCDGTGCVVIWKVPVVCPASMTSVAGTDASVSPLDKSTVAPPEGAGLPRTIVAVDASPPVTVDGSRDSDTACGVTVSVVDADDEPRVPVTVAEVVEVTSPVVKVKVAFESPALTVTDDGTETALVFELVRVTTDPPLGASPLSTTSIKPELDCAGVVSFGSSELTVTDDPWPPPPCANAGVAAAKTAKTPAANRTVISRRSRIMGTPCRTSPAGSCGAWAAPGTIPSCNTDEADPWFNPHVRHVTAIFGCR
jgi:hypothetical protein